MLYWHASHPTAQATSLMRGSADSAGLDLVAILDNDEPELAVPAQCSVVVNTSVRVVIPEGHYGLVLMRSGMGFKHDLMCHPGVIDADYRGVIRVKVFNLGHSTRYLRQGERFAQLIVQPYTALPLSYLPLDEFEALTTERGGNGFGSTGK